jgi:hypothetical protein
LLPVVFGAVVFKLSVWCGAEGCVSSLRDAARKLPDTCRDSFFSQNKFEKLVHLLVLL